MKHASVGIVFLIAGCGERGLPQPPVISDPPTVRAVHGSEGIRQTRAKPFEYVVEVVPENGGPRPDVVIARIEADGVILRDKFMEPVAGAGDAGPWSYRVVFEGIERAGNYQIYAKTLLHPRHAGDGASPKVIEGATPKSRLEIIP